MRRFLFLLVLVFILTGCKNTNAEMDRALSLRNRIASADLCSFTAEITADYQAECYVFKMDCIADGQGNVKFTVKEPETISGITGQLSDEGGKLTFDDKYLVFAPLVDGQITPVSAPGLFLKALRSGYITGCSETDRGFLLQIDDTYQNEKINFSVYTDSKDFPCGVEIYWQGRRVVTILVENFTIV